MVFPIFPFLSRLFQRIFSSFTLPNPRRVLTTLTSVHYAYMMEYRGEIVLWILCGSAPFIMLGLWLQAAGSSTYYGLDAVGFIRYFLAVFLTRQLTVVWVIWEFEREVVEGILSFRLVYPIDPIWHHLMQHVGERFTRLPFIALLVIFCFVLYPKAFWVPSVARIVMFLIATILAFILHFIIQYTFSMLAFWVERARSIESLWFFIFFFLSGIIAPLTVFPQSLAHVLFWTPLPYLVYVPAAVLVGLPVPVLQGIIVVIGWIIIITAVNRWCWHQGLKQYSGMGA